MAGGSGSKSKSSTKPVDLTPGPFRELQGVQAQGLRSLITSGGGQQFLNSPEFEGLDQFVAQLSEDELGLIDRIVSEATGGGDPFGADEFLRSSIRGDRLLPESNPFLQATIDAAVRPLRREFEEGELLDRAFFTRGGQTIQQSSPFSRARAVATEGFLNAVGDVSARIAGQNFQAREAERFSAAQESRIRVQQNFEQLQSALQAAALPRLVADLGIERGLEEFDRRMRALQAALGIGAQVTSPVIASKSKSRSVSGSGEVKAPTIIPA